jgi:hypothetical protein
MTPFGEDVWAAAAAIVELSVDSAVVNIGLKFAARRRRPDRDSAGVPGRPEGADTSVGVLSIRAHPHPASPSRGAPSAAFSASKRVDSFGQVYRVRPAPVGRMAEPGQD